MACHQSTLLGSNHADYDAYAYVSYVNDLDYDLGYGRARARVRAWHVFPFFHVHYIDRHSYDGQANDLVYDPSQRRGHCPAQSIGGMVTDYLGRAD